MPFELSSAPWDWWLAPSGQGYLAEQMAARGAGRAGRAAVSLVGPCSPAQSCPARACWDLEGVFISHLWPMAGTLPSLGFVSLGSWLRARFSL